MKKIALTSIVMLFPLSVLFAQIGGPGFGSGTRHADPSGTGGNATPVASDPGFADPQNTVPISQHVYEGIAVGILIAGYAFQKRRKVA